MSDDALYTIVMLAAGAGLALACLAFTLLLTGRCLCG